VRIFAVSDLHVDHEVNAKWVGQLSTHDYQDDVLIVAGDLTDKLSLLAWCLRALTSRFKKVLFVPGNHELWLIKDSGIATSFDKASKVVDVARASGASMETCRLPGLAIVPLMSWYDYSFGEPSADLQSRWMDFHACRWPAGFSVGRVAAHFMAMNPPHEPLPGERLITFSHFLPRIDLMPSFIPPESRILYPVLGSDLIERRLRAMSSSLHVYGHSHVNRNVVIDGVSYVNNAFGYPAETRISARRLLCIHDG
jgi:Icc-related predicted phosphoesterase